MGVIVLLTLLGRLHTYHQPLDRDLTSYALIGRELLAGKRLYTDVWDNKPPLVHVVFAAAEAVAGPGPAAIYLMNALTVSAVLLLIFVAARAAGAGEIPSLTAVAGYALLSFNITLQANQPNLEAWINPCLLGATALLLAHLGRPMTWRAAVLLGLLAGLATLFKHVAVFPAAAACTAFVLLGRDWPERIERLRRMGLAGMVVFLAWAAAAGHFIVRGRGSDFYDAVFRFNATFVESSRITAAILLKPGFLQLALPAVAPPLVSGAIAWRARGLAGAEPHLLIAAAAWGALAAALAPGKFYPHYFQLLFPCYTLSLALLVSVALEGEGGTSRLRRAAVALAAGAVLLPMVVGVVSALGLPAQEWSKRGFGSDFLLTWAEAPRVRAVLAPGETFYDLGSETGLYYLLNQSPPTTVFYHRVIFEGPMAPRFARQAALQLERRPPDLITILSSRMPYLASQPPTHPVLAFVQGRYRMAPQTAGSGFRWLVLRDSDLDRRLSRTGGEVGVGAGTSAR